MHRGLGHQPEPMQRPRWEWWRYPGYRPRENDGTLTSWLTPQPPPIPLATFLAAAPFLLFGYPDAAEAIRDRQNQPTPPAAGEGIEATRPHPEEGNP